ncbi:SemiSWEET transporter [Geminocystis sp. CENA526]|uniref:SemiSWEET transporter n=1 Tax=Geminocystis sp. CENA526 TaxID=1355871 RepID=UPI003D6F17AC
MELVTIIGLMAGSLTTISFLPQVIKTWRSKSAKDISLSMFLSFCIGVLLWIIYGLLLGELPIIIANFITLILAGTILFFKVKYP